MYREEKVNHFL